MHGPINISLSPCSKHPIAGRCVGLAGPRPTASLRTKLSARDNEPTIHVPKIARGIHCCANLFYFFVLPDQLLNIVKNVCVYIYTHTCVQFVYELPLLPDNTARETYVHKLGAGRSVDWIFTIGTVGWRWPGEYVTLGRRFYCLLLKQEMAAATVTDTFHFFISFIVEAFIWKKYIYI